MAPAAAPPNLPAGPGVYYWKTSLNIPAEEYALAREYGFTQLYLRLADVDWRYQSGHIDWRGKLTIPERTPAPPLPVTPVVYLLNDVLRRHPDPEQLGKDLGRFIADYTAAHSAIDWVSRWQIDCDWTPGTRAAYFTVLRTLRAEHPGITLSATIRLHQYRERTENGVPPVDEGLLMCYNLTPVNDFQTPNSIFQLPLLKGYLKAPPYPLPLDAALPVFEWGAAFRDGVLQGIVAPPDSLGGSLLPVGPGRYLVQEEVVDGETYLRPGDDVRYDGPESRETMEAAAALLRARPEVRDLHLFDWSPAGWQKFAPRGTPEN